MFWKHQPSPNDGQNITNKKEFKFYIKSCSTLDESITMIQNETRIYDKNNLQLKNYSTVTDYDLQENFSKIDKKLCFILQYP